MNFKLRPKLTYANMIASIALFVALGGAAVAAGLPKGSVGPKQLKHGAVTAAAIRKQAVTSGKLAPKSVIAGKLGPNAVLPGNIGNGAISSAKIGAGAVIASSIKNGVVTTNKLANANVTTAKLADGSVTNSKLGPEVAPLLGTLKSGQTLRGMFSLGGSGETVALDDQTFQFPLTNAPTVNVIDPATATTVACPGITGGNGQTPGASAGQLCIYVTGKAKLNGALTSPSQALSRLGFGLQAAGEPPGDFYATGQWAVTAP
jgi:trimeric autotransporter adhesin